ncbi:hypothetical protein [Legionella tunisiensis]|uniref:hypothetical protein n=1 Tax=Legionella tunisiensis TaxID=1034944 RepID=UPI000306E5BF|nr:hypothetical protein [Legionella tunisiensis]
MIPQEKLFATMMHYPVNIIGYLDPSKNNENDVQNFKLISSQGLFGDLQRNICSENSSLLNTGLTNVHMEFSAYYLTSAPNATIKLQLHDDAQFFITDKLSGCTFLAIQIGESVTCFHINRVTEEGDIDPLAIDEEVKNILSDLGGDENDILLRLDKIDTTYSDAQTAVIGTCIDNQWSFHYQTVTIAKDIHFTLNTTLDTDQKINIINNLK